MSAVDLSKLPAPEAVETLSFEAIFAERVTRLQQLFAEQEIMADWDPTLESDVIVILLQEQSYREMEQRQRINDGVKACMVALAEDGNLDNLVANFNVERLTITPEDTSTTPTTAAVMETNSRLRNRAPLAFEAISTAGPDGGYEYHALSASALVDDAKVDSPAPVEVVLTILPAIGADGAEVKALVEAALPATSDTGVRPLTDDLTVQLGTKREYSITATLDLYDGPDAALILAAANDALSAYTITQRVLGGWITDDGVKAALRVEGVRKVTLTGFTEIICDGTEYPECSGSTITKVGDT